MSIRQAEPAMLDANNPASPLSIPLKRHALLLLDYHNIITHMTASQNSKGCVEVGGRMRKWALEHGMLVVHGLIDLDAPRPKRSKGAARFAKTFSAMMDSVEDPLGEPAGVKEPQVKGEGKEVTLSRPLGIASALYCDGIRELFEEWNIEGLILCGIAVSGIVLSTTTQAVDEGYVVSVVEDACCDVSEESKRVLLERPFESRAHVLKGQEWIEAFESV